MAVALAISGSVDTFAYTFTRNFSFSSSSPLKSGNWVKVEVSDPGVYEISYAELQQMGFTDPANVSVYGCGGQQQSQNLVLGVSNDNPSGNPTQSDNLQQVYVYHKNNKLFFYGLGTENPILAGNAFMYDDNNNIYTTKGHYFLTDSGNPLVMPDATVTSLGDATERKDGMDYRYYEQDNIHGLYNAGQKFWDFDIMGSTSKVWNNVLSYPDATRQGSLKTGLHLGSVGSGTIDIGINSVTKEININQSAFKKYEFSVSPVTIPADGRANVVFRSNNVQGGDNACAFFDYWILSYPKTLQHAGKEMVQERIAFPSVPAITSNGYITVPEGSIAFDITNAKKPKLLTSSGDKIGFDNGGQIRTLMVFDPAKTQMQTANPVKVANQDLHGYQNTPLDFIIFTVPEYRSYADEIAELHRAKDNINVLVVDVQECYNEFTSGNPNPQAIRTFVKMIYEKGNRRLKNVLMFGPVRSDARNVRQLEQPEHFIIGIQEDVSMISRQPAIIMDFYGMTSDQTPTMTMYETPMDVGVGNLFVSNATQARNAVTKIREYLDNLDSPDMAWIVNETFAASCTGDNHTHDNQARDFDKEMQKYATAVRAGRFAHTTMIQDFFSTGNDTKFFTETINDGKLFSLYIGHAGHTGLGNYDATKRMFAMSGDFLNLKNRIPSFMFFAGCDLTNPDYGGSGLGEISVLDAPRGLIGSVSSTRTAWSNDNAKLATSFTRNLFYPGNTSTLTRTNPATIGEVYARTKTEQNNFNEATFICVGDPALTVPVPLRYARMEITNPRDGYRGGDVLKIEGTLETYQHQDDIAYNGQVVLKLMAPDLTQSLPNGSYTFTFTDNRILAVKADVVNGKFSVRIPLPKDIDKYMSRDGSTVKNLHLLAGTYNPTERLAGGGMLTLPMAVMGSEPEIVEGDEPDNVAPAIGLEFDPEAMILKVSAADDVALFPGIGGNAGTTLTIDGVPVTISALEDYDDAAVSNYVTSLPLDTYAPGKHVAKLNGRDMAGNNADEKILEFTISNTPNLVELSKTTEYGIDSMTFKTDIDRKDLTLIVLDTEGNEVYSTALSGKQTVWNCAEAEAGIYRAAVRAENGKKICSNWIELAVID